MSQPICHCAGQGYRERVDAGVLCVSRGWLLSRCGGAGLLIGDLLAGVGWRLGLEAARPPHFWRRERKVLHLRRGGRSRGAGERVSRGLTDHDRAAGGREDRHEAEFQLGLAGFIPRNPDAVGIAQLGGLEMLRELVGCEDEFAVGRLAIAAELGVIVGIDDELPRDRHRLVRAAVEIDSSAKAACGRLADLIEEGGAPNDRHLDRRFVPNLLWFRLRPGPCFFGGLRISIAVRTDRERCQQNASKLAAALNCCHGWYLVQLCWWLRDQVWSRLRAGYLGIGGW